MVGFLYLQPKHILWTYVSPANPPHLQKLHKHNKNFEQVVISANNVGLQYRILKCEHINSVISSKKLGEKKENGSP